MKVFFIILVLLIVTVTTARIKRAPCDSTYSDWAEWTTCESNCGFCGTQTRNRVCTPISGCSDVTCSGEASESQPCSTTDDICLAPNPSCCPHTYKKMADLTGRRFYCALE